MKLGVTYPNLSYFTVEGDFLGLVEREGYCAVEIALHERQLLNGQPAGPCLLACDPRAVVADFDALRPVYVPSAHLHEMTTREQAWLGAHQSWPAYELIPEYAGTDQEADVRRLQLNPVAPPPEMFSSAQSALSVLAQHTATAAMLVERMLWSGCDQQRAQYLVQTIVPHFLRIPGTIFPLDVFEAATSGAENWYGFPLPARLVEELPAFFHIDGAIPVEQRHGLELPEVCLLRGIVLLPSKEGLAAVGEGLPAVGERRGCTVCLVLVAAHGQDPLPYLRVLPPAFVGDQVSQTYALAMAAWAWLKEPMAVWVETKLARPVRRQLEREGLPVPVIGRAGLAFDKRHIIPWVVPGGWERAGDRMIYRHPLNVAPGEVYAEPEQRIIQLV